MLLGSKGRACHTREDAEQFIAEFIVETLRDPYGPMQRHSLDYDLYLPWLQEEVWNSPTPEDALQTPVLDRIYMDAAWSLVMKGYLRPGPRTMSAQCRPQDYGKGYSLTAEGRAWLAMVR